MASKGRRSPYRLVSMLIHVSTAPFTFERLDASKALLLIVDHQLGLLQLVRDYEVSEFRKVSHGKRMSSAVHRTAADPYLVSAKPSSTTGRGTDQDSNVIAHAEIGKLFNLPVVMTTVRLSG